MLGFIKKDINMVKSNFKLIGVLLIVYAFLAFTNKMDISFILPFISVMIMISSFSYDSFNNWDAYMVTLPNGRKNGVLAKYLTTFLLIFIISLITLTISLIISYTKNTEINYLQIFTSLLGTIIGTLLVVSFMYPLIYKLGIEKARISIFLIIFGLAFLGSLLINHINISHITNALTKLGNLLVPITIIITLLLLYISYIISLKIIRKKEY